MGPTVSVITIQLCRCNVRAAANDTRFRRCGCARYLEKQATELDLAHYPSLPLE